MDASSAARRKRNQRYHEKSKANWEAVSLRLPKGGKSRIDQMAHHFGVARPALFDVYLLPFLGVIAEHQVELSRLAKEAGCSIPTLLTRLIRAASVGGLEGVSAHRLVGHAVGRKTHSCGPAGPV